MKTERLVLRKWTETDADSLFEYAKNPEVGPVAGWPPHKSVERSNQKCIQCTRVLCNLRKRE